MGCATIYAHIIGYCFVKRTLLQHGDLHEIFEGAIKLLDKSVHLWVVHGRVHKADGVIFQELGEFHRRELGPVAADCRIQVSKTRA